MKFLVKKSNKSGKKLMAIFDCPKCNVKKVIHFGAEGMSDFTKHKDTKRRDRYLARHNPKYTKEKWNIPDTPASLSRWILWNKPTFDASLTEYKSRFKLK